MLYEKLISFFTEIYDSMPIDFSTNEIGERTAKRIKIIAHICIINTLTTITIWHNETYVGKKCWTNLYTFS